MGKDAQIVGRFAPSPTGRMHLGNIFAAFLSWLSAKSRDGRWLLRIEDLDPQRSKQEYADMLMQDLEWLGLHWDGEVLYQSQRTHIYAEYADALSAYTYPCTCSRNDILAAQAPHETDGRVIYPGTCRIRQRMVVPQLAAKPAAIRLMVPDEQIRYHDALYGWQQVNLATQCGDFIIRRSDGVYAYQLAVVVDDALSGVTEIVRGRDLLLSAAQQIYLYTLLGFTQPAYCHHPLLVNTSHQRLCKRDKSLDMGTLRARYTAEELLALLVRQMHYPAHVAQQWQECVADGRTSAAELLSLAKSCDFRLSQHLPTEDIVMT